MNTRSAGCVTAALVALACSVLPLAPAFAQAPAAAPMTPAAAPAAEKPRYAKKWRISSNHNATSAGTLVFQLTPKGGAAQELTINIAKPVGENEVAREIRDQLKAQLDPKLFHIETDDGEDVLVKKRGGAADFALVKTFGSVESVKITVRRD